MNCFFSFLRYFFLNVLFSLVYLINNFHKISIFSFFFLFIVYTLSLCPAFMIFYLIFLNSPLLLLKSLSGTFFSSISNFVALQSVLNSISPSTISFFSSSRFPHSSIIFSSHLESEYSHLKTESSNSSHNSSKLFKFIYNSFLNIKSLNNKFIYVFKVVNYRL